MAVTYSVALPVVGIDICSAKEVLDAHLEKANEVGSVYFSTSNRMDPKKLTKVSNILLVSKEFTYIADLVLYQYLIKNQLLWMLLFMLQACLQTTKIIIG